MTTRMTNSTILGARRALIACVAGLALLSASCGRTDAAGGPPNVILICLDTVRADHLTPYGYTKRDTTPFLNELASRSVLFEDASSTAGWTKPSVPSILTGTLPLQHGVYRGSARSELGAVSDVLDESAQTLAETFSERGYQTAAFIRNAQLRRGMGFEQGFEQYVDKAGDAREIRWKASDWIDDRDPGRPFFLYLHFLDAHWPYPIPEEYANLFAEEGTADFLRSSDWRSLRDRVNDGETELSPEQLEGLLAVYDGALRYLDDELARLWRELEREGLADDTIICVVADHGEEFMEHGRIGHGHGLYENLLQVPWILHAPGVAARRVETPVSLVDLYPTLLSAAGIRSARTPGGIDRLADPELESLVLAEHLDPKRYHLAWRQGDEKRVDVLELAPGGRDAKRGLEAMPEGSRWEARLRAGERARFVVERLRPSEDQDERPPEWKGVVESLEDGRLVLMGLGVRFDGSTELYGETRDESGRERPLVVGMLVKARGELRDGELVAQKIKLYADDAEQEWEVRGCLHVTDAARPTVAGVELVVDESSDLQLGDDENDLAPSDVLRALVDEEGILSRSADCYDLEADGAERAPSAADEAFPGDPRRLGFLRKLLETRTWGEGGGRSLDSRELDELRAIGYVE